MFSGGSSHRWARTFVPRSSQEPGGFGYCDPPYFGTEDYYSRTIDPVAHTFLAEQLNSVRARAIVSYYRFDRITEWYPPDRWEYRVLTATKNCMRTGARKERAEELLLLKRG